MRWPGLERAVRRGLVAGAAGTAAIEIATYLDMVLRGRPSSPVPTRVAKEIGRRAGLELDENRATASGALMGLFDGLAAGVLYGIVRSATGRIPWPVSAVMLAAGTLALSEGAATRLGATDWSRWNAGQWIEDIVPRLVYGSVTAVTMQLLSEDEEAVELRNLQDTPNVRPNAD